MQINLCRGLIVKFLIVLNTTPGKLSFINVSDWPRISPHFQLFEQGLRGFCPKSFSPNKFLNLRCHVSSSLSRHRVVVNERCSKGTLAGCRLDIPSVKRGDTFDPQASREFSIRELSARFVDRTSSSLGLLRCNPFIASSLDGCSMTQLPYPIKMPLKRAFDEIRSLARNSNHFRRSHIRDIIAHKQSGATSLGRGSVNARCYIGKECDWSGDIRKSHLIPNVHKYWGSVLEPFL